MSQRSSTLEYFRARGYEVDRCDCTTRYGSHDLFGFGDFFAFRGNEKVIVQHTEGGEFSRRKKKILSEPRAEKWLRAGGKIVLIDWRKVSRRKLTRPQITAAKRKADQGMSVAELCRRYKVSRPTMKRALQDGELPANETYEPRVQEITMEMFE